MRRYESAPRFLYYLFTYGKNTRLETPRLLAIQEKKMRAMVRYAYDNVPFYHKLLNASSLKAAGDCLTNRCAFGDREETLRMPEPDRSQNILEFSEQNGLP